MNNYYMYNYSLTLTYHNKDNDDIYRKELLQAFNLKEYDDDAISSVIDSILPIVVSSFGEIFDQQQKMNKLPFPLDNHLCIILLVSWEYFHLFHKCIGEIKENKITDSITNLLNELKNKK